MNNHDHAPKCQHTIIKYCKQCDVTYCVKCGEEWSKYKYNWYQYCITSPKIEWDYNYTIGDTICQADTNKTVYHSHNT